MIRVLPTLAILFATLAGLPVAAQADEIELLFHRQVAAGYEAIHASSLLPPSPPPPGPPPSVEDQARHDTIQWLLARQIFTPEEIGGLTFEASVTNQGIVLSSSWGGGDIIVILNNGPFYPYPEPADWLFNLILVRSINNGY